MITYHYSLVEQQVLLLSKKTSVARRYMEWWMLNKTANTAVTILKQANNLEIGLTALNEIYFELTENITVALVGSDLFQRLLIVKAMAISLFIRMIKFW
jgi:hypothetical protein